MRKIKPKAKKITLKNLREVNALKYNRDGLIPAVIQDAGTLQVLMVAYMNKRSLSLTLKTKLCTYWSRSRKRFWVKGETSGHFQHVKKIYYDCDKDTLLIQIKQIGPACHTGQKSCFFTRLI